MMDSLPGGQSQAVAITIDMQKVFDSLSWTYRFAVLKCWGLCEELISWICVLYSELMARVRIAHKFSDAWPISCGTRQGCPLTPVVVRTGNGTTGA